MNGNPYQNQQMPQQGQPMDPYAQNVQYPANQQMPGMQQPVAQPVPVVAPGSPEMGPVDSRSESAPVAPEYGNEAIKRIEQSAEQAEHAEAPKQQPQTPQQPKAPVAQPVVKPPSPVTPKFFGYNVPPTIAANQQLIMDNKGKGDSGEARTWLYIFLDRLLKKQAEH